MRVVELQALFVFVRKVIFPFRSVDYGECNLQFSTLSFYFSISSSKIALFSYNSLSLIFLEVRRVSSLRVTSCFVRFPSRSNLAMQLADSSTQIQQDVSRTEPRPRPKSPERVSSYRRSSSEINSLDISVESRSLDDSEELRNLVNSDQQQCRICLDCEG